MLNIRRIFDTKINENIGIMEYVDHAGKIHWFRSLVIIHGGCRGELHTWHEEDLDAYPVDFSIN